MIDDINSLNNRFCYDEFVEKYGGKYPNITIDTYGCIVGGILVKEHSIITPPVQPTPELIVTENGCGGCGNKTEPTDDPPSPSTIDMVFSAGTAVAKWLAAGAQNVSIHERELRLSKCRGCNFLEGARCKLCGCFVRLKSWMATENCPNGEW